MDSLNSIPGGDKAGNHPYYIQQELFKYWNARLPAAVVRGFETNKDKSEYSSALYLDLFDPLFGLNKEQISLLQAQQKIIAVNGSHGTGKSAMLTILAAYWIKQKKYQPDEMLLITLTEHETNALRQNLESMVGEQAAGVTITTFEKICFQLLSGNRRKITRLYNRNERLRFISLIFPFLSSRETGELSSCLEHYYNDQHQNRCEQKELAEAYLSSMERMGAFDTAALAGQTYRFLIANPGVLANFKHQYKILLIDDFQDIKSAQYKILSLLTNDDLLDDEEAGKKRKIIIFNDHQKAINHQPARENPYYYSFLSEFAEKEYVFQKNYRSQKNILQAASTFAKSLNHIGKSRKNLTHKTNAGIRLFQFDTGKEEADFIAGTIHALLENTTEHNGSDNIYPGDIAIFSGDRGSGNEIAAALQTNALPFYTHSLEPIIHRSPFSCIFSFFHFMLNEKDITSLAELLLHVLTGFTIRDVQGIFLAGNRKEETLAMLVNRLYTSHQLTDIQYSRLTKLLAFMKKLKTTVNADGIAAGLELILQYWKKLDLRSSSAPLSIDREYRLLFDQAEIYKKKTVEFLQSFYFDSNAMLISGKKELIHLLEFTAARGLDFKITFITGMEEGNCPAYTSDLALEYRLFYLAFTRAREQVFLTSCRNREGKQLSLSSFITDLGLDPETTNRSRQELAASYSQQELIPGKKL